MSQAAARDSPSALPGRWKLNATAQVEKLPTALGLERVDGNTSTPIAPTGAVMRPAGLPSVVRIFFPLFVDQAKGTEHANLYCARNESAGTRRQQRQQR